MTTFLIDGERVKASSATELVQWMHAHSRSPAADDKAYMMDVSDRTVTQSGDKIRTGNHAEFVNDLIKHGLIKHIKE